MALENPRRRKLTELVADHVFRHVDRDELAPVVNGNSVADEVRVNGGPARPGAHDLLVVDLIHCVDLLGEVIVDEGTFFR